MKHSIFESQKMITKQITMSSVITSVATFGPAAAHFGDCDEWKREGRFKS